MAFKSGLYGSYCKVLACSTEETYGVSYRPQAMHGTRTANLHGIQPRAVTEQRLQKLLSCGIPRHAGSPVFRICAEYQLSAVLGFNYSHVKSIATINESLSKKTPVFDDFVLCPICQLIDFSCVLTAVWRARAEHSFCKVVVCFHGFKTFVYCQDSLLCSLQLCAFHIQCHCDKQTKEVKIKSNTRETENEVQLGLAKLKQSCISCEQHIQSYWNRV